MGAWIETKLIIPEETVIGVAPYMGAWIETIELLENPETPRVAPYMGAWIETAKGSNSSESGQSRTLHGSVD